MKKTVGIIAILVMLSPLFAQESRISRGLQLAEPSDLRGLTGRPIRKIEIVQRGRWRSEAAIQSVRTGEPLTAAAGRRAARELLATGGFADVVILAEPFGDGVKLRLEAVPRRLIAVRRLIGRAPNRVPDDRKTLCGLRDTQGSEGLRVRSRDRTEVMSEHEPSIGLEVHAELDTQTKLFCNR